MGNAIYNRLLRWKRRRDLNKYVSFHDLYDYIGKEYNEEIIQEMNKKYYPYSIDICDELQFNQLVFLSHTIRCVIENGKIGQLQIN